VVSSHPKEATMEAKTGDHILVEGETVGQPERGGDVLEVIEGTTSITYRVRWDDGRESLFTPAAGAMRVTPGR
jgi:Domain of unknown function (DUF1918)